MFLRSRTVKNRVELCVQPGLSKNILSYAPRLQENKTFVMKCHDARRLPALCLWAVGETDITSFFLEDICFSRERGCAGIEYRRIGYRAVEQVGQDIGSSSFYATRNQGKQLRSCVSYFSHQRKSLGTLRYINAAYLGFF